MDGAQGMEGECRGQIRGAGDEGEEQGTEEGYGRPGGCRNRGGLWELDEGRRTFRGSGERAQRVLGSPG